MLPVLLLCACLQTPSEPPSGWLAAALSAHVIAQTVDATLTTHLVASGQGREANPLMRWAADEPIALGLVKGAVAVASTVVLVKLAKRHPKAALVTAWVITGLTTAAVVVSARALKAGA